MAGTYATDLVALFVDAGPNTGTDPIATGAASDNLGLTEYSGFGAAAGASRRYGDPNLYYTGRNSLTVEAETTTSPPQSSSVGFTFDAGNTVGTAPTNITGGVMSFYGNFTINTGTQDYGNTGTGGGGIQAVVGQNATPTANSNPYKIYRYSGGDIEIVGGWIHFFVDPQNTSTGETGSAGTYNNSNPPTGAGIAVVSSIDTRRDVALACDGVRWGRHTFSMTGGNDTNVFGVDAVATAEASSAANFVQGGIFDQHNTGAALTIGGTSQTLVDSGYHRLGQVQPTNGGFELSGIISIGTSTTACYFDDRNTLCLIPDHFITFDDFNRIEIRNNGTTCNLINFTANFIPRNSLIPTGDAPASPRGNIEVFNNPTVLLQGCSFNDMGTFIFQSNTTLTDTTLRRCGQATQNGATITGSTFEDTTSDASLIVSTTNAVTDFAKITNTKFNGDGSNHAIEFDVPFTNANTPSNITLAWSGNTLTDNTGTVTYTAGSTGNFSSTGADANAAIALVNNSSQTITISVVDGSDIPSVENTGSGTVTVVSEITVTISGLLGNTEVSVLENPSPYTQTLAEQQAGSGPVSLFNEDFVSAVTGTDIEVDTNGTANVIQILSSTTDFTNMTGLVAGDFIRVTERVSGQNLRTFDTFEVVSVAANVIDVVNVASSTLNQQSIIDATGDTITVEKINASYTFAVPTGEVVDILLFRVGSLPLFLLNQTISSTNNSFPVSQTLDRNFEV